MRHGLYGPGMETDDRLADADPTGEGLPEVAPDVGEQSLAAETDDIIPSGGYQLLPVVALGGSAGSIGALRDFFEAMPADSGVAFVVILHLSAEHESHLDALLARATGMPVAQATDLQKLEPDHVYVIPPAKHLWLQGDHLRLSDLPRQRGQRVPVDLFFRALADTHGPHAVAIVLSGVDGDGALGIKRIKERGGLTIAQEPTEAQHSGMPEAAINTGMVDWVLPVRQMPERLLEYLRRERRLHVPPEAGPHPALIPRVEPDQREQTLREVLTFLRTRTGRDFSYYKRATIVRRIARRMQVNGVDDVADYLTFLRSHPGEANALLKDLLISVTNFFRDRDAFTALEAHIPELFARKASADTVRVWVPACATGEEAYSIAMLLCEHAHTLEAPPTLQVFATDLDEEVVAAGRRGFYPASIATDVSEERLQRFFNKDEQGYRVRRELREMVLFALHDLLKDSPFSRLDLISCRNLLIYLDRDAQKRAFEIFHFALCGSGQLFLGASEGVEDNSTLFEPLDKKHRIYAPRTAVRASLPLPVGPSTLMQTITEHDHFRGGSAGLGRNFVLPASLLAPPARELDSSQRATWTELHLKLIETFAPPSLIVNREYDILHLSENAARFLQFTGGEPSTNLLRMVHPMLRLELRSALFRAGQTGETARATGVPVDLGGRRHLVDISVSATPRLAPDLLLVVLRTDDDAASSEAPAQTEAESREAVAPQLEAELDHTKGRLRDTIERYEASTEELKASNEELQAMNEELRSATEELETSREELQSINEELTTVNQELKSKVEEVSHANSDLHNLMGATAIPTVFLNRDLRIMRFTPSAADIFNIIPTDLGRRLGDLSHRLDYPTLLSDAARVLEHLTPIEREVRNIDESARRIFIARLLPYRTTDDHIGGVVLTLVDVTERLAAQEAMQRKEAELREAQRIALMGSWAWDARRDELSISADVSRILKLELTPRCFADLEPLFTERCWLELDAAVRKALGTGLPVELDLELAKKGGAPIWVTLRAEVLRRESGEATGLRGTFQDVTARRRAEERVRASAARLEAAHRIDTVGIVFFDPQGLVTDCNDAFLRMSGQRRDDIHQRRLRWDGITRDDEQSSHESAAQELYAVGHVVPYEKEYVRQDGSRWWAFIAAARVSQDEGVAYVIDISQKKGTEAELQRAHEHLESRVRERTLELNQANTSLRNEIMGHQAAEQGRQDLLQQLVSVQEDERRRISRELHDQVGQQLTGIMLGLKSLQSEVGSEALAAKLQALRGVTEQLGREIHQLALELRPTALDDLGLARTLANYLEDWSARTHVKVDFHTENLECERLPGHIETTLYRIVQEGLNNVLKHAEAQHVSVIVEQRNDHVLLIIEDDGGGFDVEALENKNGVRRLGLLGIRERAALLQGELDIESSPGRGTTLFVRIPLHETANP